VVYVAAYTTVQALLSKSARSKGKGSSSSSGKPSALEEYGAVVHRDKRGYQKRTGNK
jgi:hypothetical protein